MDGVLVNSEPLHEKAQDIVCRRFGLDVPKSISPIFKGWTEDRVYDYIAEHYGTGSTTVDALVQAKHAAFASLVDELELISGAARLVQELSNLNIPLGLVTSATRVDQERAFAKFGLFPYFSSVTTVEDVTEAKPHPQPYLTGAERLGVRPEGCIVIEDSKYGVVSALRAGCYVLGLATTFSCDALVDAGAHAVFNSIEEIEPHLKELLSLTVA
ncbi:MAG: HAD family phosphatase [Rhodothermaceae bacterium]|nr:HAD family phosphatase [Rhodothermaceae bacterium]MYI84133.1 HAD family phosphatase [Rhodothermaceae bacterium]